jgi:hypothetical protein
VKAFVHRNFYVDDALSSHPTADEAIDLLNRTKAGLQEYGNLRLHKISSNSDVVLSAFATEDLVRGMLLYILGITRFSNSLREVFHFSHLVS